MVMQASLFSVPVVQKNRATYNKTLLLNAKKVLNFHRDGTTNYTIFYYLMDGKKLEFKAAKTFTNFDALIREAQNEETIPMYVTSRKVYAGVKATVNRVEFVNVETFGMAYDNVDAVTATVFIDEGDLMTTELQVTHTIDQINRRASTSYSYSETGI
jgi:hypothetical protein